MKRLLNNKQKEEIKEFLFKKIVYKSNTEQNEIKKRLKKCLLKKKAPPTKIINSNNKPTQETFDF